MTQSKKSLQLTNSGFSIFPAKILFLLSFFALSIVACDKEKEDADPVVQSKSDYMIYNDIEYDLLFSSFDILDKQEGEDYQIDILLGGMELQYMQANYGTVEFYGTGEAIRFHLYNNTFDTPADGIYTYNANTKIAGTFAGGILFIEYPGPYLDAPEISITDGSITIEHISGDIYNINFNCTTDEGLQLIGNMKDDYRNFYHEAGHK